MTTAIMLNLPIDRLDNFLAHVRSRNWTEIKNPIIELKKILTKVPDYVPGTPGINVHYDLAGSAPLQVGRIMLTTAFMTIPTCDFHREANGIVLSFPEWKVLSLPPPIMRSDACNAILKNLSKYTVYKALDGTIVTLYYYNDKWVMATANGYDVGEYTRLDSVTFQQAFDEVIANYPGFSYDKLDRNNSYTIGFKHLSMQPLPGPQHAWLVAINSNASLAKVECNVGLPKQPKATLPTGYKMSCSYIRQQCADALKNYSAENPNTHIFGFIFRSGTQNLFLESTLMTRIRKLAYNIPKKDKITNINTFIALRAYLKVKTANQFITLFPQYKQTYAQFDEFFSVLTRKIQCPDDQSEAIDQTANQLALQLCGIVELHHINSRSVIRDYIMNEKYIDLYLTLIPSTVNAP